MLSKRWNFFGPSSCGYRRSAYDRLYIGWSPAPEDIWTDLFMWRKFLVNKEINCATRHVTGAFSLNVPVRSHMSIAERVDENRDLFDRLQNEAEYDRIIQEIRAKAARENFNLRFPDQP